MTYRIALINRQWRILANDEPMMTIYPDHSAALDKLRELRAGMTATFAGELTRKQAASRDAREANGR